MTLKVTDNQYGHYLSDSWVSCHLYTELWGVYTIQQTSSKLSANLQQFTCILNTFAGSLLDVCWIV